MSVHVPCSGQNCRMVPQLWHSLLILQNFSLTLIWNIHVLPHMISGPLFTEKTPSYWYWDPHYKPKAVIRLSQVYNKDSYTCKMASFLVNRGIELWNKMLNSYDMYLRKVIQIHNLCMIRVKINSLRPDNTNPSTRWYFKFSSYCIFSSMIKPKIT